MPKGFVYLKDIAPGIQQDIRYASASNFIGRPIPGYNHPQCILTLKAAKALRRVQEELKKQSLSLKVFDCYRPQKSVDHFVKWALDLKDQKMKKTFYPAVPKNQLFQLGYIASKSGHSRGSTVDLTLVDKTGNELDMGTTFDFFGPDSHTENESIAPIKRKNRFLLKSAMDKQGFRNLKEEWWHYTLINESFPNQYFNFDVE